LKGYLVLAAICFAGTVLGLMTAQQAIGGRYAVANQSKGPWTVWPAAVQPRIDPYTRAHLLSDTLLPSNRFETLELEARVDSAGRALDENCSYVVSGAMPKTRWWSILAVSGERQLEEAAEASNGLIAQQLVYGPDGTFQIVLSSEPQSGNWIRPPESGPPVLLIRLYSPEPALRRDPLAGDLPVIERQVCR
jgi:hypothetical protein